MRGLEGSDWLEDTGVQGACPFSHHRICTHIYKDAPGGSGGSGPARTGRARPATVESETPQAALKIPMMLTGARVLSSI